MGNFSEKNIETQVFISSIFETVIDKIINCFYWFSDCTDMEDSNVPTATKSNINMVH